VPKFRVHLVTVASTAGEVEADDGEAAVEKAFDQELPYAPAFASYEFGEWSTASESFPDVINKPENDYEEISA
jgi:hypothetical protein